MARIPTKFNVPSHLQVGLGRAALLASVSRSEIMNRALATATHNFVAVVAYRLTQYPISLESIPMSYTVEPTNLEAVQGIADKLSTSRDQVVRLALDYYLREGNKNGL